MEKMTLEEARERARQAFDQCEDTGYSIGEDLEKDKDALAAIDRAIEIEKEIELHKSVAETLKLLDIIPASGDPHVNPRKMLAYMMEYHARVKKNDEIVERLNDEGIVGQIGDAGDRPFERLDAICMYRRAVLGEEE